MAGHSVIAVMQAAMVAKIGHVYGWHFDAALAWGVTTFLASDYVKHAFLREVLGFVPIAGNVLKASLAFGMTEGIGNLADSMLRCDGESDTLLSAVADYMRESNDQNT